MLLIGIILGALTMIGALTFFPSLKNVLERNRYITGTFGEHAKDIIYIFEVHPEYKFRYISPSLDHFLGQGVAAKSYLDPSDCFERVHPDDLEILMNKVSGQADYDKPFLQRWRTEDGDYIWFEEYATPLYEGEQLIAIQGIIRNVEQAMTEKQILEYQSRHDALTGLFNRFAFDEHLLQLRREVVPHVGILIIDLNDLKKVNDTHGHSAGDELLKKAAACLKNETVHAYRLGGDEFAIIDSSSSHDAFVILHHSIVEKLRDEGISCAVGSAQQEWPSDIMALYHRADEEMYQNKRETKTLLR
ncbi:sensor domain-containing diguanylate cyclase [Exiguobacterium flavidum]|uniref:sensor domain-containing diguanylate cyclase n=1 Tax=Exiguobacterium flavidum TaxID=2184695 RepID=UPI000DF78AD5|nr:sensor domain-containing diguanylate cyclase [Exiguobacterium flavidum]